MPNWLSVNYRLVYSLTVVCWVTSDVKDCANLPFCQGKCHRASSRSEWASKCKCICVLTLGTSYTSNGWLF